MIESHELKNRDRYLKKLIGFQDTEPVKVITGIGVNFCLLFLHRNLPHVVPIKKWIGRF